MKSRLIKGCTHLFLRFPSSCKAFGGVLALLALFSFLLSCRRTASQEGSLQKINYQPYIDTSVAVYGPYMAVKLPLTRGVKIANPTQLALGPGGVLYAANSTGEVYSLRDTDEDGLEDMALLYCDVKAFGLRSPAGLAHRGDTLYVGCAQQIRAFLDLDQDGKADTSWVFFDRIPHSEHPYEWTSGFCFGPDGWLYVALATDSWNAGASPDPEGYRGAILRIAPDGKRAERIATGIRSVYGMAFSAEGDLFFTDNEGGGNPLEELNLLVRQAFYGHNRKKYGITDSTTGPVLALGTEVAPSGIAFNQPGNDFGGTRGNLFVAFYGPGERWTRGGVGRITRQRLPNGSYTYQEAAVADVPKLSDLSFGKDGSLYLAQHGKADYWYNSIHPNEGAFYKLVYDPALAVRPAKARPALAETFSSSSLETGKQLFAELACLGCHAVDGVTEKLGPNLKEVGKRLTRPEILEEIISPSQRIKPSMMAVRVVKKDGQVLLGRVVSANAEHLSLMLVGNQIVEIPRVQIEQTKEEEKSLMYQGLLTDLPEVQREALLDYMISLSQR